MEKQRPQLVIGAFIFNDRNELFLRTTPSQNNKYTCINGKVEWGNTIEAALRKNVKEKTGLDIVSFSLIGLTDGLHITATDDPRPNHLIFADYKVAVRDVSNFKSDDASRKHAWLMPTEWLSKGREAFGPYIYEVVEKLK